MEWVLSFFMEKGRRQIGCRDFLQQSKTAVIRTADAPAAGIPSQRAWWMFDMEEWKSRENYSEIVDCVISRMQMEHLKKRIQEVFGNAEKELIFYDSRHRKDFSSLLIGRRKKNLCGLPNYAAAVFLSVCR